ncbi:acetyl/propionyl/methylcrotonyl-CoA carboxylase subunit alpha [Sinorhizobium sp. BG8]|uniref:acetyl-CoA carboxylase biotin carboxylase subunit n=1 Tax=Sinorhizobium sp. BG8 TaxID=2613773 RepID=UPI00193E36B5|nr:acetyl/propionyl/methylcrotonyl-CoA carboxylase subunit alpha [Sinorhizobium sp. BG8]QRM53826.1 acetyl/propionyl/methylcrotonyl-CoA carboxylase subunit alpha [Sinorhizobium sp. BG8]
MSQRRTFNKILIANRGEIACRVMRTASRLGMSTVAVYSDADHGAQHVALADEAYRIGPAEALKSYLDVSAIIAACRASGAEAVHPGYGFLSENPAFVDAVEAAGLVFIGPSAASMRAMGLKDAAKALMETAGVPVVPGYHGEEQDPDFLAERAEEIGYPVLIKARAGGGGKGMRRVDDAGAFRASLASAARESEASFGDGRVLVEKYMAKPRHIEFQVFGDKHGKVVHLFERDCSVQRRHQKVIEEAPAPGMTGEMREAMGMAAVRAAEAIGYSGAGTVEFIADVSDGLRADRFFFMEMNTRLQVEHPVTEAITGLDLVEWQIRVAAGEPLPWRQEDLRCRGWAFEARIYAENPARDFLPATGRLTLFDVPGELARIDSGVRAGDEITPFYDPMIAKVIVHGSDRDEALGKLRLTLERSRIAGLTTNVPFLSRLLREPDFAAGDVDTGLIARRAGSLLKETPPARKAWALAALSALDLLEPPHAIDPWDALRGFRLWGSARQTTFVEYGQEEREIAVTCVDKGRFAIDEGDGAFEVELAETSGGSVQGTCEARSLQAVVARDSRTITVFLDGETHVFVVADLPGHHGNEEAGGDILTAPMPGLVRAVSATAGAAVSKGDPLVTMEAMKMELVISAPRDGIVESVGVSVGQQVAEAAVLLRLVEEKMP